MAEASSKSVGGRRGKGQRAHDHEAIPLHTKCHRQFHDAVGFCEGWSMASRRKWQDDQVITHRARYLADQDAEEPDAANAKPQRPSLLQEAEGFRSRYPEIGPQGQHDLIRLLRKVQREATS
jgi:hypothetical protein